MPSGLFAPRVIGANASKIKHFQIQEDSTRGTSSRYPLGRFPFKVDVSFGGITRRPNVLQINNRVPVLNSLDKIRTKLIWEQHEIPMATKFGKIADFVVSNGFDVDKFEEKIGFPAVAKLIQGEKSKGFKTINTVEELESFLTNTANLRSYFLENKLDFDKEYRIHVAPILENKEVTYFFSSKGVDHIRCRRNGVICVHQKLIKTEAYNRGVRHTNREGGYDHIVLSYVIDERIISNICPYAVQAIKLLGLDFGFVDVGVNSSTGEFYFFESGSNPELTNPEISCYKTALSRMILEKGKEKQLIPTNYVANMNIDLNPSVPITHSIRGTVSSKPKRRISLNHKF